MRVWGLGSKLLKESYKEHGEEKGNYCSMLGLYRDNEKENGNYHKGCIMGYVGVRDWGLGTGGLSK